VAILFEDVHHGMVDDCADVAENAADPELLQPIAATGRSRQPVAVGR
jgi:hypothetical protein